MSTFSEEFAAAGIPELNEQFGETVTFYPAAGGDSRSITGVIAHDQQRQEGDWIDRTQERIRVRVDRDAETGVAEPGLGDALKRAGDTDNQRFGFTGEIAAATEDYWVLVFTRDVTQALGTDHR